MLGAGVAGLQAIATARRLGAVVEATFDVRKAAKEQVESLGAKFVEVETPAGEDAADRRRLRAKEVSGGVQGLEQRRCAMSSPRQGPTWSSSPPLIPGKRAPLLLTAEMVAAMKPGSSIIVDLAAEQEGNAASSTPSPASTASSCRRRDHRRREQPAERGCRSHASQMWSRNMEKLLWAAPGLGKDGYRP